MGENNNEKVNNLDELALAILDAREERAEFQQELIKKYNMPLISARINYPGLYKDNKITRSIMKVIYQEILSKFNDIIVYEKLNFTAEGPCLTLIVEMEPLMAKSIAVDIEDRHPMGRLADLDVYNLKGMPLSRTEFGLTPRKCYLCGDTAHNCVRSKKHNSNEVIDYIKNQYMNYKLLSMSTPKIINNISKCNP